MARYALGDFDAAVDEFKQAYELSQAPGLLFNLAQASRLGKDYEQALHFYRTYLRVRPNAANRKDAEKRIGELEPIVERAAPRRAPSACRRRRSRRRRVAAAPPTTRPVVAPRCAAERARRR